MSVERIGQCWGATRALAPMAGHHQESPVTGDSCPYSRGCLAQKAINPFPILTTHPEPEGRFLGSPVCHLAIFTGLKVIFAGPGVREALHPCGRAGWRSVE